VAPPKAPPNDIKICECGARFTDWEFRPVGALPGTNVFGWNRYCSKISMWKFWEHHTPGETVVYNAAP
jgi:hypothetical protein